jgi:hypothetical protein
LSIEKTKAIFIPPKISLFMRFRCNEASSALKGAYHVAVEAKKE